MHAQCLPDALQLAPGLAIGQDPVVQKAPAKSDVPLHRSAGMAYLLCKSTEMVSILERTCCSRAEMHCGQVLLESKPNAHLHRHEIGSV